MGRIIQIGIRPEPLCTNTLNCFTMISDYIRLWVISHPWNMRKTKESLNTTVHQSQYTSGHCACPQSGAGADNIGQPQRVAPTKNLPHCQQIQNRI